VLWAEQLIAGPELARAVVVGAIAATAFILFISPHRAVATPRHALGGHAVGVAIASSFGLLMATAPGSEWLRNFPILFPMAAALSVGGAMLTMAATNTEHPPGAGTALALAAHGFNWQIITFVCVSVLALVAIHRLVRPWLIDLY
jgi:CBS-domain-containing membrane protein